MLSILNKYFPNHKPVKEWALDKERILVKESFIISKMTYANFTINPKEQNHLQWKKNLICIVICSWQSSFPSICLFKLQNHSEKRIWPPLTYRKPKFREMQGRLPKATQLESGRAEGCWEDALPPLLASAYLTKGCEILFWPNYYHPHRQRLWSIFDVLITERPRNLKMSQFITPSFEEPFLEKL